MIGVFIGATVLGGALWWNHRQGWTPSPRTRPSRLRRRAALAPHRHDPRIPCATPPGSSTSRPAIRADRGRGRRGKTQTQPDRTRETDRQRRQAEHARSTCRPRRRARPAAEQQQQQREQRLRHAVLILTPRAYTRKPGASSNRRPEKRVGWRDAAAPPPVSGPGRARGRSPCPRPRRRRGARRVHHCIRARPGAAQRRQADRRSRQPRQLQQAGCRRSFRRTARAGWARSRGAAERRAGGQGSAEGRRRRPLPSSARWSPRRSTASPSSSTRASTSFAPKRAE